MRSETTKDIFTRQIDFEGYRIYIGRDEREASLSTLASYDRLNFDKWVFRQVTRDSSAWELDDIPLTVEHLRCLYGRGDSPCTDNTFDPLVYTLANPYHYPLFADSFFFFVLHEHNDWQLGLPGGIKKLYPAALQPTTLIADSIADSCETSI